MQMPEARKAQAVRPATDVAAKESSSIGGKGEDYYIFWELRSVDIWSSKICNFSAFGELTTCEKFLVSFQEWFMFISDHVFLSIHYIRSLFLAWSAAACCSV